MISTYFSRLESDFAKLFGDITPPNPLPQTEASDGIAALTDEDTGNED